MNNKYRITSILVTSQLNYSITGIETFNLPDLQLSTIPNIILPLNLRLGHLVEKVVSELIKASNNYNILYENVQLIENNQTIGEIDYIIQNIQTKELTHMELAYKFYLLDPTLSKDLINNWIGPNRKDSLKEKLNKLNNKQFPLLNHRCAKEKFKDVELEQVSQSLCFLASLFIPYEYKECMNSNYKNAVKGYYINLEKFIKLDCSGKSYYIPTKKEWGISPKDNNVWTSFNDVIQPIKTSLSEERSTLCWQNNNGIYSEYFIIWW